MYLGKALQVDVSGYDKQSVIDEAKKYCEANDFQEWNKLHREFKIWVWKYKYKIVLYKPIDFKVERGIVSKKNNVK